MNLTVRYFCVHIINANTLGLCTNHSIYVFVNAQKNVIILNRIVIFTIKHIYIVYKYLLIISQ